MSPFLLMAILFGLAALAASPLFSLLGLKRG
jgi:hypothetical protein